MKKPINVLPWAFAGLLVLLIALTCRVTIVPDKAPVTVLNEAGEEVAAVQLSRVEQFALDNWESRIMPTIRERAVDAPQLLSEAVADLNAAGGKYGSRANETSAWSFCVKGTARVIGVENADKPNRTTLLLDAPPYDGQADYKLHYGKVFSSNIKNAIRDGVGFLKLDDFANQVEFADLTTAFNDKVKNEIILAGDAQGYLDKTVSFYGCISLQKTDPDSLVIVPVELKVSGE